MNQDNNLLQAMKAAAEIRTTAILFLSAVLTASAVLNGFLSVSLRWYSIFALSLLLPLAACVILTSIHMLAFYSFSLEKDKNILVRHMSARLRTAVILLYASFGILFVWLVLGIIFN